MYATKRYALLAKDTVMLAEFSHQRGDMYRCLHDKQAVTNLRRARQLFSQVGNDTSTVHALCQLVDTYSDFAEYDSAGQSLKEAQALKKKSGIADYWMNTHFYESALDYYRKTNQWPLAYDCQLILSDWYTYRTAGERDYLVAALDADYQTEQKESQLKQKVRELSMQQLFTAIISVFLLLNAALSVVFFLLYRRNQRVSRQNEELVNEQNHRVKNNLQLMSSLFSLQAKRLTDPVTRNVMDENRLRLQSLIKVQARLYNAGKLNAINMAAFIPDLANVVLNAYGFANADTTFNIEEISLPVSKAVPLGLIVNELMTNACKYALPYTTTPALIIDCHRNKSKICLTVADNGPGLDGPAGTGWIPDWRVPDWTIPG